MKHNHLWQYRAGLKTCSIYKRCKAMKNTEYLNKVLSTWNEFCRTHKNIEKAIRELLEENRELKAENKKLKAHLDIYIEREI